MNSQQYSVEIGETSLTIFILEIHVGSFKSIFKCVRVKFYSCQLLFDRESFSCGELDIIGSWISWIISQNTEQEDHCFVLYRIQTKINASRPC